MNPEEKEKLQPEDAGMDSFFADPVQAAAEPERSGGLSKNMKLLVAGVAALVICGGVLTVFLLTNRDAEPDTSAPDVTEEAERPLLNPASVDGVQEVHVHGVSDFTVTAATDDDGTTLYSIREYADLPVDNALLSTLAANGSMLSAESLVEEDPSDLSKYGLDDPAAEVTLSYTDGTVFTLQVGNVSPMNRSMTYCGAGGSVYLVRTSLVSNYQREDMYFISKTILEEPPKDAYPIVESLRVEREDLDYDMYMEYVYDDDDDSIGGTAATHVMYEPIFAYLNVENSTEVTNGMFGLTASKIMTAYPKEQDLVQAGLDAPSCTVTMACDDGNTYVLRFGDTFTEEGTDYYYAQLEGSQLICAVTRDKAIWATTKPENITSSNMFATFVWNISKLDVRSGEQSIHFTAEGDGRNEKAFEVKKDGGECDNERFRQFYRFILGIYGESLCIGEKLPAGQPDATVHVETQDGKEDYTMDFYRMDSMKTIVAVNGLPSYIIRSSCLDTMARNIEIFDNTDEDFSLTWQ